MTDQSVDDHVKAEALFEPVLKVMLSLDPADMTYSSREEAYALLEKILTMGKVIGRRTAVDPRGGEPLVGQVWRLKSDHSQQVKIIEVTGQVTVYQHIDCACVRVGHTITDHEGRSLTAMFKEHYEPVEEYDPLIRGWLRFIDGPQDS